MFAGLRRSIVRGRNRDGWCTGRRIAACRFRVCAPRRASRAGRCTGRLVAGLPVVHRDAETAPVQRAGDGRADAPGGAGHECDAGPCRPGRAVSCFGGGVHRQAVALAAIARREPMGAGPTALFRVSAPAARRVSPQSRSDPARPCPSGSVLCAGRRRSVPARPCRFVCRRRRSPAGRRARGHCTARTDGCWPDGAVPSPGTRRAAGVAAVPERSGTALPFRIRPGGARRQGPGEPGLRSGGMASKLSRVWSVMIAAARRWERCGH